MGASEDFALDVDPADMDPGSPEFQAAVEKLWDTGVEGEVVAAAEKPSTKQGESGAASGAVDDQDAEGVLTADGKRILPFSALKNVRAEATANRLALEAAQARLNELEAQIKQQQRPGDEIDVDVDDDAGQKQTDDVALKLKQLAEDFPEFGEVAQAMQAQLKALQSKVSEFEAERQQRTQEVVRQKQMTVEQAIEANADLTLWQNDDPDAWERAVEFDAMLRQRAEWQGKPIQERFEKVVALVRADLPNAKSPQPLNTGKEKSGLQERVDAALAAAGDYVPESLSHIPGGKTPSGNDSKFQSPTDLEAFFETASQDQIDAYLAKFG